MSIIADLHIHSRFSRATSAELNIENLQKYALIKGVDLLGTGDFTHPEWIKEIKQKLQDDGTGILRTKEGFPFVLQGEISLIYTQDGKGRKVHLVLLAPNLEVVSQITEYLKKRGRVDYDGRPIFGIPCPEFTESMKKIDNKIEIIPAHCLLPGTYIHLNPKLKKIEDIREGDKVLTHRGEFKKVLKTYKRVYNGKIYRILPWYFREGSVTTSEHPYYAIKSFKNCSWIKGTCKPLCSQKDFCKKKSYKTYSPSWVQAEHLEKGDFLVYPRVKEITDKRVIRLSDIVLNLAEIRKFSRTKEIKDEISVNKDFCRLAGYYLAEGYTIGDEAVGFSFNKGERGYIQDVVYLMKNIFGTNPTKFDERKGTDILFYSQILNIFFSKLFYSDKERRAWTKAVPSFMLFLPREKQIELLRGWWRGDSGYTVSHELANQMKIICIRLGIIPSISRDSAEKFNRRGKHFIGERKISTERDLFVLSNLSFFEGRELLSDRSFKKFINKRCMKHGWVDEDYIYLPIRNIEIMDYKGEVYNLEVESHNSYVSEFAAVHNCWTPWFGIFGSAGGFDSVKDCFKDQTNHIHALETGLSSDPAMNWRLSQLDPYSIISFSDLHSHWPWRLGREATIFDIKLAYDNLIKALRTKEGLKGTIEVDPGYGKYHYTGHRNCNICLSPTEALKVKDMCPKCGRKLTVGVLERVEALADRPEGYRPKNPKPFMRLIPLSEILAALLGKAVATQAVWKEYNNLIANFKSEFNVLLNAEGKELAKFTNSSIAEAIIKNREGKVEVKPGYDGEYGVPIFSEEDRKKANEIETKNFHKQTSLSDF